jgi:hypothetical protein
VANGGADSMMLITFGRAGALIRVRAMVLSPAFNASSQRHDDVRATRPKPPSSSSHRHQLCVVDRRRANADAGFAAGRVRDSTPAWIFIEQGNRLDVDYTMGLSTVMVIGTIAVAAVHLQLDLCH